MTTDQPQTTIASDTRFILSDPNLPVLQCDKLLRELPGKRQVFSGNWGAHHVVAKLYSGARARRHWHREKRGSEALHKAQISSPEVLFSGNLKDGRFVLIYQALPAAISALEHWQNCDNNDQRLKLLQQLIELVAKIHKAGLIQTDIHLNNFLLSHDTLYAIDGDGIRCYPTLLHSRFYRKNLALLLAQLPITTEALTQSAIPTYQDHHPQAEQDFSRRLLNDLSRARRKRRLRYVAKCTRTCSEFVRRQSFSQLTVYRRDCHSNNLDAFLRDPDSFMEQGTLLKDGNSATVAKVNTSDGAWVIKRYNIKGFFHGLKCGLRPTRAWISWRNAHRLSSSGITTPQAIAVLEKRVGLWRRNCYYVSAWSAGSSAATLDVTAERQPTSQAESLVKLFQQLFVLQIYHGDCKATNFLLNQGNPVIIDLDAMGESRWKWLFKLRYRKDRQRFLKNWPVDSPLHHYFNQKLP